LAISATQRPEFRDFNVRRRGHRRKNRAKKKIYAAEGFDVAA
jgi:hypothetical protein